MKDGFATATDLRHIVHQRWLACFVRRWHANPDLAHTHDYNQGHAGRVAVLLRTIWPDTDVRVLWAALTHDMGEGIGDMPGDTKRRNPSLRMALQAAEDEELRRLGLRPLSESVVPAEAAQIKFCDSLDAYKYAAHFAPQVLTQQDWVQQRAWIETRAAEYGVRVI